MTLRFIAIQLCLSLQTAQVTLLLLGLLVQRSSQGFLTSNQERNHGNQLVISGPGPSHGGFQENTGFQNPFQGQGTFQVSGPFQASGPFPASGQFQGPGNFQGQGNYQGPGNFQAQGNYQGQVNFQGQGNHQGHGHFQGQGNFQGPSNFQETRAQPLGMNQGHHGGFSPEPHVSIQPASVKVVYVPVVSTSIKASSLSKLTGEQALSKEQGHSNFQGPVQQNSQQEAPKSVSYSNSFNGKASALNKPYTRSSTSGHATIPIIIIQKDHHSHMKSQQSGGYQTQPVQSVQTQGTVGQAYMKQGYSTVGQVQQQHQHQQHQQQLQQQQQQQQQQNGYGALAKHTQGGGAVIPVIIIQKTGHAGLRHQQSGFSFQASPPPVRGPTAWSSWR
ncbi:unnamed protein product [Ixodes persulcatus]